MATGGYFVHNVYFVTYSMEYFCYVLRKAMKNDSPFLKTHET